ncbi:MAG TPA: YggS family pyridoxal phosphate-dependent enzyme [Terriglobales bacterium]|nr:YggS family pyridoxal phosphate-dependent enzyme [Terriglobales bacterium]
MAEVSIANAVDRAQQAIAGACARRGRRAEDVRLLGATKTVPAERIREAWAAGLRLFGENRVQERLSKQAELGDLAAEWHLLGPLQSNKAGRALEAFDVIETVASLDLAARLARLASAPVKVMLEINLAQEPQKHGLAAAEAEAVARALAALPQLRLIGLMAVPPESHDPEASRPHFAALAELGERVRAGLPSVPERWELSMGMSHDFVVAVEEGATLVRLGTALFGSRPPKP